MSEPKLISPLLDNFIMGDPISEHDGVQCCPAINKDTDDKYIVKIISVPESQSQVDALLLSGAFADNDAIMSYYKSVVDGIIEEITVLQKLSQLEGFSSVEAHQVVPKDNDHGYDVYILSAYRNTLRHLFRKAPMTQQSALNLGLDLCAALSVARRMGYMYADLKPGNIYINNDQEFRIGDIGFISMNSLQYASLPDRYHSDYTPPEIADAYSKLNQTIDIYALGLILYQAYNDGQLPSIADGSLPAPAHADIEIAEIILKACAENPDERWQDPVDLGQALVNYMQVKGIQDIPLVSADHAVDFRRCFVDESIEGLYEGSNKDASDEVSASEEAENEVIVTESAIFEEDGNGNLTLIGDETNNAEDAANIDYEDVTSEVSDILAQADELIAHVTPTPVIAPEPIDVPIPTVVILDNDENPSEGTSDDGSTNTLMPDNDDHTDEDNIPYAPAPKKRNASWIIWVLIGLIIATLTVGAIWGYKTYYVQTVDNLVLTLEDGGTLIVNVTTSTDEKNLIVSCTDIYGNTRRSPVLNGTARFTGLIADSAYNIKVTISGFHTLKGKTTASIATPAETEIQQLQAITGKTDGSVIITFEVNGPDVEQWNVSYKNKNGVENNVAFTGHSVTIKSLVVGEEYTFTVTPATDLNLIGKNTIKYIAKNVVRAKDIVITGCYDQNLCVEWTVDEGVKVDNWTVRCYNESFETKLVVKTNSAIIQVPNDADGYTIEVTAKDMAVTVTVKLPKNTTTITDFSVTETAEGAIKVTWTPGGAIPADGLILNYTVDGFKPEPIIVTEGNSALIDPVVPGGVYTFEIASSYNVPVINGTHTYTAGDAKHFEQLHGTGVVAGDLQFSLCTTPEDDNWRDLYKQGLNFKTDFSSSEMMSIICFVDTKYQLTEKAITFDLIIRDQAGKIVGITTYSDIWSTMVIDDLFKFDIPATPAESGSYTITLLLNDDLVHIGTFTVTKSE